MRRRPGGSDSGAALEQALGEDERQDAQAAADGAAEPERLVVVLDPGHGGTGSGAVGFGVIERDSNLDFALRVEQLLLEAGFDVILTRRGEARTAEALDLDPDEVPGFLINRRDLQARVDLANAAEADVFVSIHSNAAEDPRASGVEVYWDELRAHSSDNERLAQALQESVLESLAIATGFRAWDRGIREDTCWHFSERWGECSPLFILGPAQEIKRTQIVFFGLDPALLGFAPGQEVLRTRATQMPAALVELLFISNEFEAQVLKDETARQAMAIGIARGIERFFAEQAVVAEQGGTEQRGRGGIGGGGGGRRVGASAPFGKPLDSARESLRTGSSPPSTPRRRSGQASTGPLRLRSGQASAGSGEPQDELGEGRVLGRAAGRLTPLRQAQDRPNPLSIALVSGTVCSRAVGP